MCLSNENCMETLKCVIKNEHESTCICDENRYWNQNAQQCRMKNPLSLKLTIKLFDHLND